ncbi:MAG: PAS domain S-box protein, partial [Bacteroidia bacterium]|nr:PAS domain S-box protein [Bacteroidia bacterium]
EIEKQKEELQLSNQNISALSEIGQKITSSLNLDAVLEKVYSSVNEMMDGFGFGIGTINTENGNIEYNFYIEDGKRIDRLIIARNNPGSFSVWCVDNLQEVHLNEFEDYSKYLKEDALLFGTRTESLCMIPLIIEKKCIGVIQVKSQKKNAYSLQHIEMLRSIASYTAIALANAQVFKIITEAKAELEKLSIVAQKTDNGVIICDAKGNLEWVNEGFSRMTGFTLNEIKEKFGHNLNDISFNSEIKKLLRECMETKHSVFYEELNKTKDGREIWVHTSLTPILDENGELKKLVAIDSDISEMKKAESALKRSEEQYRILFDRNGDFIFIYDKATHFILDCNQTFIDVYGYTKEEIKKMTPFDLHPMEEQNFVALNIDVESPEIANYYTHITKNGKHLQVEARSVEIEFNSRHAWLVIVRDVTERKKSEEQIRRQHDLIEAKNKDITDSINYAKRIQSATLATDAQLKNCFKDHFVLFRPRDIVSGDFYWMHKADNGNVFLATADCTGHGVPGAIMSVIGTTKLEEIVSHRNTENPAEALNFLRKEIIELLNPEGALEETDDGIDMVLCNFILNGNGYAKVDFACAKNPLWLIRENKLIEFLPDKFCVGMDHASQESFTRQSIDLVSGDVVYTFSDGYADQLGGPKGKKFKSKVFQELLLTIHKLPMEEQKNILAESMSAWQGEYMQTDDICVIGVCI